MRAEPTFLNRPLSFWAEVKTISQDSGYVKRGSGTLNVPDLDAIRRSLKSRGLSTTHVITRSGRLTEYGRLLQAYFSFRAEALRTKIEPLLMNAEQAKNLFTELRAMLNPRCPLPMNKQKGTKRTPAFLTGLVNMIVEAHTQGFPCEYDPRHLVAFSRNGRLVGTLSRHIDGAFPSLVDPVAVWEIKEYYHTTTFGSRVADAVYETLLDGMELQQLAGKAGNHVRHYLIIDAHYTWWVCGKSYLCRLVDLLHMGYVDELLVGREVPDRLPSLVKEWVASIHPA